MRPQRFTFVPIITFSEIICFLDPNRTSLAQKSTSDWSHKTFITLLFFHQMSLTRSRWWEKAVKNQSTNVLERDRRIDQAAGTTRGHRVVL